VSQCAGRQGLVLVEMLVRQGMGRRLVWSLIARWCEGRGQGPGDCGAAAGVLVVMLVRQGMGRRLFLSDCRVA
jgi:hypothetical protein